MTLKVAICTVGQQFMQAASEPAHLSLVSASFRAPARKHIRVEGVGHGGIIEHSQLTYCIAGAIMAARLLCRCSVFTVPTELPQNIIIEPIMHVKSFGNSTH